MTNLWKTCCLVAQNDEMVYTYTQSFVTVPATFILLSKYKRAVGGSGVGLICLSAHADKLRDSFYVRTLMVKKWITLHFSQSLALQLKWIPIIYGVMGLFDQVYALFNYQQNKLLMIVKFDRMDILVVRI